MQKPGGREGRGVGSLSWENGEMGFCVEGGGHRS